MARHILLFNRGSGGNDRGLDAQEVARQVEEIFREAGHEVSSRFVEPRGIERALKQAIAEKPDAIVVAGGDGTVSAAARHLGGSSIALGILPMGTFNLAARDLGVPLEMEEAARFLASARPLPIDILDVSGQACLCTTILGFYPEFAKTFERRDHGGRWWKKTLKLVLGLPKYFARARPLQLSWRGDDGEGSAKTKFSAFVPGRYKAAAGIVPARTEFRSGELSAYIATQKDASAAVRGMLDYVFGRQEKNPELLHFKSSKLELRDGSRRDCMLMLDGEILRMGFPIELEIKPGHLFVLTTPENIADEREEAA
ncbi:diacylglycerol kinase family protein [Haloferula sp. BvORR071]|uniref:diacylglycerol/lipid kinase family protein n=1 Tax=Haloferula sp. BvORR071 TaxID=1396141 RepID=UPI0005540C48|nr:diacylglycerol kinase family protein [Haloferula sp. BvORR071]